jgi:hypothetical protein
MHISEEEYLDTAALTVDWDLAMEKAEQRAIDNLRER